VIGRAAVALFLLAALAGCGKRSGETRASEQARFALHRGAPEGREQGELPTLAALLEHPFYLVKEGGASPLGGERPLLPGFGVTVRRIVHDRGEAVGVTESGLRLRLRDLQAPLLSPFEGIELDDGKLQLAWVRRADAPVLAGPDAAARVVARGERLARVALVSRDGPEGFYRTREGWMSETDLAVPATATRPAQVGPKEVWLDVSLRSQTLVVYAGDRPTFATLISAGVGAPGSDFATPVGTHRIVAKRLMTRMSNLDHRGVPAYYSYEEVPLAQLIGRVALHGVYWHDGFGQPRSHGCINLSLRDALRLFRLTRPILPAGATEISAERGGTVVRVR
jgi:hypothetical protein